MEDVDSVIGVEGGRVEKADKKVQSSGSSLTPI
jgi:hypothetical protein